MKLYLWTKGRDIEIVEYDILSPAARRALKKEAVPAFLEMLDTHTPGYCLDALADKMALKLDMDRDLMRNAMTNAVAEY